MFICFFATCYFLVNSFETCISVKGNYASRDTAWIQTKRIYIQHEQESSSNFTPNTPSGMTVEMNTSMIINTSFTINNRSNENSNDSLNDSLNDSFGSNASIILANMNIQQEYSPNGNHNTVYGQSQANLNTNTNNDNDRRRVLPHIISSPVLPNDLILLQLPMSQPSTDTTNSLLS